MKETLNNTTATSSAFTADGDFDVKVQGSYSGHVWMESQTPGETSWELVEDTLLSDGKTDSFPVVINDPTIAYRFNSNIAAGGAAIVYANTVTVVV
jgi:hypothetical protein